MLLESKYRTSRLDSEIHAMFSSYINVGPVCFLFRSSSSNQNKTRILAVASTDTNSDFAVLRVMIVTW